MTTALTSARLFSLQEQVYVKTIVWNVRRGAWNVNRMKRDAWTVMCEPWRATRKEFLSGLTLNSKRFFSSSNWVWSWSHWLLTPVTLSTTLLGSCSVSSRCLITSCPDSLVLASWYFRLDISWFKAYLNKTKQTTIELNNFKICLG